MSYVTITMTRQFRPPSKKAFILKATVNVALKKEGWESNYFIRNY